MASQPPVTIADFKSTFDRDFKYGLGLDSVRDTDITRALTQATSLYNPALFSTADGKVAFLFAAAHLLVVNVQAAGGLLQKGEGQGLNNAPEEILNSKSVGGLSMGIEGPSEFVMQSTLLRQFWSTDYGRRYLAMVEPKLRGAFGVVPGPRMDS